MFGNSINEAKATLNNKKNKKGKNINTNSKVKKY
jgi:hypothetical protein